MKQSYLIFIMVLASSFSCAQEPTLRNVSPQGFYIGVALNGNMIAGKESQTMEIVEAQFNSITAENIHKWQFIHPKPDVYAFSLPDSFVNLGEKNKMFMVGHTLVWHSQVPRWVFQDESGTVIDRETLLQRMQEHIFKVVGRYKGRIHGWDVVNEAIDEQGGIRPTKWQQIIGDDYIQKAFEFAREADPDAELYYNDYSLFEPAKREGVVRLIKDLQSKGVKVDAIGMQGHWALDYPGIEELEKSIIAFSELGCKVAITELDINVLPTDWGNIGADISANFELQQKLNPYTEGLPDSVQHKLTEKYRDIFKVFKKHHDKVSRVTIWGVSDGRSWLNHWPVRGRTNYPLLFDRNYQPKPAFHAVMEVLKQAK